MNILLKTHKRKIKGDDNKEGLLFFYRAASNPKKTMPFEAGLIIMQVIYAISSFQCKHDTKKLFPALNGTTLSSKGSRVERSSQPTSHYYAWAVKK